MSRVWLFMLSSAVALGSWQAHAQGADTMADIRCVAVGMHFAESPDSHQKSTGTLLVLYYMGRLDGRAPGLDIGKLLAQQIDSMKAADYSAEATRCAQTLSQKGAQIKQLGEDMQKHFK
ncbi:MAG TPA: hypothetical protein VGV09_13975 [Steroidobacteraceae bacterium]|nr:hypothetical protein [Steroidobacteraceae bacterium]